MSTPSITKIEDLVRHALSELSDAKEQLRAKLDQVGVWHPAIGTLETAIDRIEATRAQLANLRDSLGIARHAARDRRAK